MNLTLHSSPNKKLIVIGDIELSQEVRDTAIKFGIKIVENGGK